MPEPETYDPTTGTPRYPGPGLSRGPELLAWLALAFAAASVAAAAPAVLRAPTPRLFAAGPPAQFSPEQVTAWVTAACSLATLVASTVAAVAHKLAQWRSRPPRRRRKKRPAEPPAGP